MLTIDHLVVTVGNIVIAGSVEVEGTSVSVTLTLPPDLRLTLDQLNALAGVVEGPVDDTAAKAAIAANDQAAADLAAAEAQAQA